MKLIITWVLVLFFAIVCIVLKKKIHPAANIILVAAITFFALLTPNGKVIYSIKGFNITLGSIETGLFKSGILLLLQYFSKIFVSSKIKFNSKSGIFINEVFSIYEKLSQNEIKKIQYAEKEGAVKKIRGILDRIDEHLVQIWESV